MHPIRLIWLAILSGAMAMAPRMGAAEIRISAAASLVDALKEIAVAYEKQSGDTLVLNFGASSTLARQIEEGAPADIFISADEAKMEALHKKGLVVPETRRSRLSNSLVIIVAADKGAAISGPADLATDKVRRIALAEPRTVPAGIYAREYLVRKQLWSAVEKKVIPTENVRAALATVEGGNVEAAIVYKTDAMSSKRVRIVHEVAAADGPAILYPMSVLRNSRQPAGAGRFLLHLESEDALGVFRRHGFLILPAGKA